MINSKIIKAIDFANFKHRNQKRKSTEKPYIVHPFTVGMMLSKINWNEETIIAGILHDVIEDTDVTIDELRKEFGDRVVEIVEGVTEPDKDAEWEERKKHTLETLPNKSIEIKLVSCADKLHNIYSISEEQKMMGDKVFEKFARGKKSQEWYYRGLVEALNELSGIKMYEELKHLVKDVFK